MYVCMCTCVRCVIAGVIHVHTHTDITRIKERDRGSSDLIGDLASVKKAVDLLSARLVPSLALVSLVNHSPFPPAELKAPRHHGVYACTACLPVSVRICACVHACVHERIQAQQRQSVCLMHSRAAVM